MVRRESPASIPGLTTTTETAWTPSGAVAEASLAEAREASSARPQPPTANRKKPMTNVLRKLARAMGKRFSGWRSGSPKPFQATRLPAENQSKFRGWYLPPEGQSAQSVHPDELAPTDGQDGEGGLGLLVADETEGP